MSGSRHYLVFDLGTTSVKAALFDEAGNMAAHRLLEYDLVAPEAGVVELDPEVYWRAVLDGAAAVTGAKPPGAEIAGIGLCSQGETFILLDDNDRPLRPAMVWMDNRAGDQASRIRKDIGLNRDTGMADVDAFFTAPKLLWIKENEEEIYRCARRILLVQDFIVRRLTGEFVGDYSMAPTTYLFDIFRKRWWSEILAYLELDADRLPEMKPTGSIAGRLRSEAAELLALPPGIPVVMGGMDQTSALAGAGNTVPGVITETTGGAMITCTTLSTASVEAIRKAKTGPLAGLPIQPHLFPDTYLATQWCLSGGMSLKWVRDNFFGTASRSARDSGADPYAPVNVDASKAPPGSAGLLFLPYMAGGGMAPISSEVRGVFWGLQLHHDRGSIARSVMEALGYLLRMMMERTESAGLETGEIRLLGGGAKSLLWRQIKADITRRPVRAAVCPEAASLGAAMQTAVALGDRATLEEAVESMVSISAPALPRRENQAEYKTGYREFLDLHQRFG